MAGISSLEDYLNQEFGALELPEIERTKRRAVDLAADVPQVDAAGGGALDQGVIPDWEPAGTAPVPEDNWDRTRVLGAGVVDVGTSLVGGAEYLARQNKFTRGAPTDALRSVRGGLEGITEDILSGVSPEYLDKIGREMLTLDPNKTIWQGGPLEVADAVYGKFLRSLPSTLAVMLPAARLFRAANTAGAMAYLGASEGTLSVGAIQNNLVNEIEAMSHEQLLKESQRYAQIYEQLGDEGAARREFTAEAQGIAPLVGGAGVAAISLATGRLLKPVFAAGEGGLSLGKRVGLGMAEEFPQEGSQGSIEQMTQNFAAQIYDQNRALMEGVGEAFVQEGTIGALTGGAVAGAFGTRPTPPLPEPVEDEGGQLNLPGFPAGGPQGPTDQGGIPTPDEANIYMEGQAFPSEIGPQVNVPITEQADLFDQPGAVRMSDPTMSPPTEVREPGQQELPLTTRRRGYGTVPISKPGPTVVPDDRVPTPAADEEGRFTQDQAAVDEATGDLFPAEPTPLTAAENVSEAGGFQVTMADEGGNVIVEEYKATPEEAEARADELITDFPDAIVRVSQQRVKPEPKKAGVSTAQRVAKPEPKGPEKTAAEEVQDVLRKNVPFDQRDEIRDVVGNTGNIKVAVERLVDRGYQEIAEKIDSKYAKETKERLFPEPQKEPVGELPDNLTRAQVDDLVDWEITYQNWAGEDVTETVKFSKLRKRKEAIRAKYVADAKKDGATVDGPKIKTKMLPTEDLDTTFEQAVQSYADSQADISFPKEREEGKPITPDEVASNSKQLLEEYKSSYNTPGKKLKLIRREIRNRARRKAEVRDVKDTKVVTKAVKGKKKEVSTSALTYEALPTEETAEQQEQREKDVKKARTRLRLSLAKAKNMEKRLESKGEYGRVIEENTLDGSPNDKALSMMRAKDMFRQLMQLANTALTDSTYHVSHVVGDEVVTKQFPSQAAADRYRAENNVKAPAIRKKAPVSKGAATLANNVAQALERISLKSMTPEKFIEEFSAISKAFEFKEFKAAQRKVTRKDDSIADRTKKIEKKNRERFNSKKFYDRVRNIWQKDPVFVNTVESVLRKFSEQTAIGRYYTPTTEEVEGLRYAMRTWRRMNERYPQDMFYKPMKQYLDYLGFRFDESGDLIVEPFSPSDNLLAGKFERQFGETVKAAEDGGTRVETGAGIFEATPRVKARDRDATLRDQETKENRQAVRDIRTANALLKRFKERIASSKTTITGIKRQEQRFIRGLRKIGAWVDVSPTMGRISIGGFRSKTYRLVGPRLDAKTMRKGDAKRVIERIAALPMPRELLRVANRMDSKQAQENIDAFVDENSIEFFMEKINLQNSAPELDAAASALGDMIRDRGTSVDVNTVLDTLIETLPEGHFYQLLAKKLRGMNMENGSLQYDWENKKFAKSDSLAKFDPRDAKSYLNRRELEKTDPALRGSMTVHAVLHEFLHGATHAAIAADPNLRRFFEQLRNRVREQYIELYGSKSLPYGLREKTADGRAMPVDEFVVEVFASENLQDFMDSTVYEGKSVWERIIDMLRKLIGLDTSYDALTMLDAFMQAEEKVFEHAGLTREGADLLKMDTMDGQLRDLGGAFINRWATSQGILSRLREGIKRVREINNGQLYNIVSMEQFHEMWKNNPVVGKFVDSYYTAWRRRNAKSSELMQVPQELSGRWTSLEQSDPEVAINISRIGTRATLKGIDPRHALTHESNQHLSDELHEEHAELHNMWRELPQEAKTLFDDVLSYYDEALQRETNLMMQSALRGMLATGPRAEMTVDEFNKKFSLETIQSWEDKEGVSEALKEFFADEERPGIVSELYRMSRVAKKRKGIYMPAMRYGDWIAYSEKSRPQEIFEDHKTAMDRLRELKADDPTLDVRKFVDEEGRHVVDVKERVFIMGESVSDVEAQKEQFIEDNPGYSEEDFAGTQRRVSKQADAAIQSNAALNTILSSLEGNGAAQAAIKNFYLRNLAETSFRKHEIKRKNRLGLNLDLQHRNLATYARQSSYYTAQLEFGWQMGKALRDARETVKMSRGAQEDKVSIALDHLVKRDQLGVDLPDRSKLVQKSVEATHFFMLASPSYWAINLTQLWMVTLPTIGARHGWGQTAASMMHWQKTIWGSLKLEAGNTWGGLKTFKGDRAAIEKAFNVINQIEEAIVEQYGEDGAKPYIELLEFLRQNHIIDINVFTEMRELAAGRSQNAWDKTIDASRIMAHLTEVNNRVIAALTAYQLEYNKSGDVKTARDYAAQMVSQTQFNYSSENKPPLFQKLPLLFQFMQWPQHMYAHLIRNFVALSDADVMTRKQARKALLGLFGTHAAVGGMIGMTLQPIKWAVGMTMMALGDDDEPYTFANALNGRTYDRLIAEISADLFGTTASTVISKGVPAGLGIDLSARMSMGTVYFVDLRGDDANSVLGSLVASFGGASLNQGLKFATGVGKIMDGEIYKGLETMSPKIFRDAMRAGRYYNEGLVNNAGDTVIEAADMGIDETLFQFFGFQPIEVSQHYSRQTAIKDAERHAIGRRGELMRDFREADPTERSAVLKQIREFNRNNPQERITSSALIKNVRAQKIRERRFRRYGANIDERKARFYERYGEAYE